MRPDTRSHRSLAQEDGTVNLEPKPRRRDTPSKARDLAALLRGFEANLFIINTGQPDWAVRVQPAMQALGRLQKSARKRARKDTRERI